MTNLLYHVDVGFPSHLQMPVEGQKLWYSKHAINAATERLVRNRLPDTLPEHRVIEVEVGQWSRVAVKWVVRVHLDDDDDLIMAITSDYHVKTVWVNRRDDNHRTLDRSRYVPPVISQ
jgi:hypothetical protein